MSELHGSIGFPPFEVLHGVEAAADLKIFRLSEAGSGDWAAGDSLADYGGFLDTCYKTLVSRHYSAGGSV